MKRIFYPDYDLILHDATDVVSAEECLAAIVKLYEMPSPPRYSIWNFGNALADAPLEEIDRVQTAAAYLVRARVAGRTAIVASRDATYGRLRQYLAFASALDVPLEQRLFRSMDEALDWLGLGHDALTCLAGIDLDPELKLPDIDSRPS